MSTVRNPFQHFVNFIEMRKILSQTPTTTHLSRSFFFDLKFSFHTIIYKSGEDKTEKDIDEVKTKAKSLKKKSEESLGNEAEAKKPTKKKSE